MRILRIHHITVAVHDAHGAARSFEQLLDVRAADPRRISEFAVHAVDLSFGDTLLQLVSPAAHDSAVKGYLQRRGEGFYNIAVEVEDLDGAVRELRELGVKVSDPTEAVPGMRSVFVTAAATHGLSLQLVQVQRNEGEPLVPPVTREEEPRAEHLPPEREQHPAARQATEDWDDDPPADATSQPSPPPGGGARLLDLSPDEWSDTD